MTKFNTAGLGIIGFAFFAMSACGESGDSTGQTAERTAAPTEAATSSQALDGQYLEGEWCYALWEASGESEKPNEGFIFNQDGTLLYNHAAGGPIESRGNWSVEGNQLIITPKFMAFNMIIKSVEPDEFVLDNIGRHHFVRGACPGG